MEHLEEMLPSMCGIPLGLQFTGGGVQNSFDGDIITQLSV